jgi:hypothetical protein
MWKKALIIAVLIIAAVMCAAYFFRYKLLQSAITMVLKQHIPEYVTFKSFTFDPERESFHINSLAIRNHKDYSDKDLIKIGRVICNYGFKNGKVLDGIKIKGIQADCIELHIERLKDGRVNLAEIDEIFSGNPAEGAPDAAPKNATRALKIPGIGLSRLVEFSGRVVIKKGLVILTDRKVSDKPYILTFEDVNSIQNLAFQNDYSGLVFFGSTGIGSFNGAGDQKLKWKIDLNPRTALLTMSNRFEAENIEISLLSPYYDEYSPIVIAKGRVSGVFVMDFDNGNIGAMGDLVIRGFKFDPKKEYENFEFWGSSMYDIEKYLEETPGEARIDFKIKGDAKKPRFYPGASLKKAMQKMAVDKIKDIFN